MAKDDEIEQAIRDIRALSWWDMARMEELAISPPGGPDTPGARFLVANRDRLVDEIEDTGCFPDPREDDYEFQQSSEAYLPDDQDAWVAFVGLRAYEWHNRNGSGEMRRLETDCVRAALESIAEKLIRQLILEFTPTED